MMPPRPANGGSTTNANITSSVGNTTVSWPYWDYVYPQAPRDGVFVAAIVRAYEAKLITKAEARKALKARNPLWGLR
jgi:hypothetical protein